MRWVVALLVLASIFFDSRAIAAPLNAAKSSALRIVFHAGRDDPAFGSVDIHDVSAAVVERLRRSNLTAAQWQSLFSIYVDRDGASPGADVAPVMGRYVVMSDVIRFTPEFSFEPGIQYSARVFVPGSSGKTVTPAPVELAFSLPQASSSPKTVVEKILPSGDVLPENLLRFYVYFSAPMSQGAARDQIVLVGPDNKVVAAAFFGASPELWDPAMRRLTILLNPGRIKRGVGPNIALGPPLRQGERYTLMVGAGMIDADGHPLRRATSKSFRVARAVRSRIDPLKWDTTCPGAGTRDPLVLSFPTPLDAPQLARAIRVVGPGGRLVAGDIRIGGHETRWSFKPSSPWPAGPLEMQVDAGLEDVSGNTTAAPFDVDVHENQDARNPAKEMSLPLELVHGADKAAAVDAHFACHETTPTKTTEAHTWLD